jgi:ABC-type nickel/cobalt efflux system permease component RcnA
MLFSENMSQLSQIIIILGGAWMLWRICREMWKG